MPAVVLCMSLDEAPFAWIRVLRAVLPGVSCFAAAPAEGGVVDGRAAAVTLQMPWLEAILTDCLFDEVGTFCSPVHPSTSIARAGEVRWYNSPLAAPTFDESFATHFATLSTTLGPFPACFPPFSPRSKSLLVWYREVSPGDHGMKVVEEAALILVLGKP